MQVGVTAYKGAVSVLAVSGSLLLLFVALCSASLELPAQGHSAILELQDASLASTASGIGAVESMHAALVRYQLYEVRCSGCFASDITDLNALR